MYVLHSTPRGDLQRGLLWPSKPPCVEEPRTKLWCVAHKFKSGESGHWLKHSRWLHLSNAYEDQREVWGPMVGLLGVVVVAAPLVGCKEWQENDAIRGTLHTLTVNRPAKCEGGAAISYKRIRDAMREDGIKPPHRDTISGLRLDNLIVCSTHSSIQAIDDRLAVDFHSDSTDANEEELEERRKSTEKKLAKKRKESGRGSESGEASSSTAPAPPVRRSVRERRAATRL